MALAGLLGAASPILGGLAGSGGQSQPDTSSAQATTTTTTNVTMGSMSKSSPLTLLAWLVVGYLIWEELSHG